MQSLGPKKKSGTVSLKHFKYVKALSPVESIKIIPRKLRYFISDKSSLENAPKMI